MIYEDHTQDVQDTITIYTQFGCPEFDENFQLVEGEKDMYRARNRDIKKQINQLGNKRHGNGIKTTQDS